MKTGPWSPQLEKALMQQWRSSTAKNKLTQINFLDEKMSIIISKANLFTTQLIIFERDFPGGLVVKTPSANAGDSGDMGLIPG